MGDTCASKLLFELIIFSFEITNQSNIVADMCLAGKHIATRCGLDVFGTVSVDKTVICLFPVGRKGRDVDN